VYMMHSDAGSFFCLRWLAMARFTKFSRLYGAIPFLGVSGYVSFGYSVAITTVYVCFFGIFSKVNRSLYSAPSQSYYFVPQLKAYSRSHNHTTNPTLSSRTSIINNGPQPHSHTPTPPLPPW
jgi:hypothetical protein